MYVVSQRHATRLKNLIKRLNNPVKIDDFFQKPHSQCDEHMAWQMAQ